MDEHHIPISYQAAWAGLDGQLNRHRLDRRGAKVLRRPPTAFGYLIDYTAYDPVPPGMDKNAFEKATQVLDNEGARLRALLLSGANPLADDHIRWARFLW